LPSAHTAAVFEVVAPLSVPMKILFNKLMR
jgi:hypothetical protein